MTTGRINQVTTKRTIKLPMAGLKAEVRLLARAEWFQWFGGPTARMAEPFGRRPRCLESPFTYLSIKANVSERRLRSAMRARSVPVGLTVVPANKPSRARRRVRPAVLAVDREYVFASRINTGFPSVVARRISNSDRSRPYGRPLH
jgi:hypothetical protein